MDIQAGGVHHARLNEINQAGNSSSSSNRIIPAYKFNKPEGNWLEFLPKNWIRGDETVKGRYGPLITDDGGYSAVLPTLQSQGVHPELIKAVTTQSVFMEARNNALEDVKGARDALKNADDHLQQLTERVAQGSKGKSQSIKRAAAKRDQCKVEYDKEFSHLQDKQDDIESGHRKLSRAMRNYDPTVIISNRNKRLVIYGLVIALEYYRLSHVAQAAHGQRNEIWDAIDYHKDLATKPQRILAAGDFMQYTGGNIAAWSATKKELRAIEDAERDQWRRLQQFDKNPYSQPMHTIFVAAIACAVIEALQQAFLNGY